MTIGPGLLAPTMVGARQDIRPRARGAGYGYLGEPGGQRGCTEPRTAGRTTSQAAARARLVPGGLGGHCGGGGPGSRPGGPARTGGPTPSPGGAFPGKGGDPFPPPGAMGFFLKGPG